MRALVLAYRHNLELLLPGAASILTRGNPQQPAQSTIAYLLRLKRDHGCPASATSEPGMTDLQMLEVLDPLLPPARTLDRQALDQRTSLLDHLRAP